MGKKFLISANCEKTAIKMTNGGYFDDECDRDSFSEVMEAFDNNIPFSKVDEYRKSLSILTAKFKDIEIFHNHSLKSNYVKVIDILINEFGKSYAEEIRFILSNQYTNQNRISFAFASKLDDNIMAVGVISEHRLHKLDGIKIVWELLWLTTTSRNRGYGKKVWSDISLIASNRGVSGILVPSTEKALPFWLKREPCTYSIANHIIRSDTIYVMEDIKMICKEKHIEIANNISTNEKLEEYRKFYINLISKPVKSRKHTYPVSNTEGRPYRWGPSGSTHVWYLPKK